MSDPRSKVEEVFGPAYKSLDRKAQIQRAAFFLDEGIKSISLAARRKLGETDRNLLLSLMRTYAHVEVNWALATHEDKFAKLTNTLPDGRMFLDEEF